MSHRTTRTPRPQVAHVKKGIRSHLRLPNVATLLTATAIIGAGSLAGLAGVDGTYAFLTDSAHSSGASVDAGSMTLSVGATGNEGAAYAIPSAAWTGLFPGDSARQQVSVKVENDPSRISSALTIRAAAALPGGFELRAQKGACPGVALAGPALSTTEVSVGTWTSAETSALCVEVKLRADAPNSAQGTTLGPLNLIVSAKQD